jgi:hypothetical protein
MEAIGQAGAVAIVTDQQCPDMPGWQPLGQSGMYVYFPS